MRVSISSALVERIMAHAAQSPGEEVCGLLLGEGHIVRNLRPADNVAADKCRLFELDPAVLFAAIRAARDGGPTVLGHYHSHPGGSARPSATDARMIRHAGELWVIVAGPEVTAWIATASNTFIPTIIETGPVLASHDSVGQSGSNETGMPG